MQKPLWFDRLRRQLEKRRLPRAYIERIVEEMTDHFHDLTEESMNSEEEAILRLGDPEQVARATAGQYRRRTFLGRHPIIAFLTFAVSPVFSFVLLAALEIFAVVESLNLVSSFITAIFHLQDDASGRIPPGIEIGLRIGMPLLFIIVPSAVLMLVYGRLARRTPYARRWLLVSCGVISAIASAPIFSVGFNEKMARSFVGAGVYWPRLPMQFVQLAIPLALGCWLLWRQRVREQNFAECEPPAPASARAA